MIIKCSGEYAFGGRTEDTFVIDDYETLDELQSIIENKQPIKCKEPTSYYKWNIIAKEDLRERIVYLNNYLKIRKVNYYVMNSEERQDVYDSVCNNCRFNDESLSSALRCAYIKDKSGNGCQNHEENYSLSKWFKNRILKKRKV